MIAKKNNCSKEIIYSSGALIPIQEYKFDLGFTSGSELEDSDIIGGKHKNLIAISINCLLSILGGIF